LYAPFTILADGILKYQVTVFDIPCRLVLRPEVSQHAGWFEDHILVEQRAVNPAKTERFIYDKVLRQR
jgi:hypothetical protein